MSQRALGRQFPKRTGDVFKKVVDPLDTRLGIYAGHSGVEDVAPGRLVATQKKLNPDRVKHYVDNPSHEPIEVMRWHERGPSYIFDGHHRAAAAKIRGDKTITTQVRFV